MTSWVSCPTCGAVGYIRPDGVKKICPRCRGERWVMVEPRKIYHADRERQPVVVADPAQPNGDPEGQVRPNEKQ